MTKPKKADGKNHSRLETKFYTLANQLSKEGTTSDFFRA